MNLWLGAALALAIALLFAVATLVERNEAAMLRRPRLRLVAYTLGLGVYCSSWTFYGAVGSAVRDGWTYLPIYLAPVLVLLFGGRFLRRLAAAVADEQASTISDFIAARFGHDVVVARLVTVTALLGAVPYMALQFRSIRAAVAVAFGHPVPETAVIAIVALLALFAMLFGTRRFAQTGRSEGLIYAIGIESVIKIGALLWVALLALAMLRHAPPERLAAGVAALRAVFAPTLLNGEFFAIMLIAAMAMIALPRQFYMALVEAGGREDLPRARWGFAAYIAAAAVLILPIALAGRVVLGAGVAPDLYVLALPQAAGAPWVLAAAMVGGIAAGLTMVVVDSTALATMVSNDLVFPTIMRAAGGEVPVDLGRRMLWIRRAAIAAIMALALVWSQEVPPECPLAAIGLVAFAAMAQFTPHLILATWGGGRDPLAARLSLSAGLALWLWTLALPQVLPQPAMDALAGTLIDPLHLLGTHLGTPLTHGVVWSLGLNLATLAAVLAAKGAPMPVVARLRPLRGGDRVTNVDGLARLTASFVGEPRAATEFPPAERARPIERRHVQRAQDLIASVVGASPARTLVASALGGGQMSLADVARLLDEGGQSLRFSRALLAATFENIDAGISVVDGELNLVAWNTRYLELFDYPPGLVRVGVPVAELVRHNAWRGDFGPCADAAAVEVHVEKRLMHLHRGTPHSFERRRADGRVLKTVGGPMPNGGYVMSFTDITGEAEARAELQQTLEGLEARVAERTAELSEANTLLASATRDKTRFLAAASHDLLQPLHAARLFAAALARDTGLKRPELVGRLDRAIVAAEDLLRALLEISKLDAGTVQPVIEAVDLAPCIAALAEGIRPLAEAGGLSLHIGPLFGTVATDAGLLRSVLRNFLTNAVRYTHQGGVLIGVRRRAGGLRIDVLDTGVGIPEGEREAIFAEFTRIGAVEAEGLGLGLAIAQRAARLIGARIELASRSGRGSRFSLLLPATSVITADDAAPPPAPAPTAPPLRVARPLRPQDVLVLDDQPAIVEATCALLQGLGHRGIGAGALAAALPHAAAVTAALVDFQLGEGADGLAAIAALRARNPAIRAVLVTALRDAGVATRAAAMGVAVVWKPATAEAIEAALAGD